MENTEISTCLCLFASFLKSKSKNPKIGHALHHLYKGKDIIWIIWDIFLNESKNQSNFVQRIISSALNLFCLRYRTGCHKKRRLLMYFIIGVLTEPFSLEEEIVKDKKKVQVIIQSIDKIYKQIKKNEHSPGTDYLYQNMKASNLEKTIAKLETMNSLGEEYVPRFTPT